MLRRLLLCIADQNVCPSHFTRLRTLTDLIFYSSTGFSPVTRKRWKHMGEWRCSSFYPLGLAPDGGEWSVSWPGSCNPKESPHSPPIHSIHWTWGLSEHFGGNVNMLPLQRMDPRFLGSPARNRASSPAKLSCCFFLFKLRFLRSYCCWDAFPSLVLVDGYQSSLQIDSVFQESFQSFRGNWFACTKNFFSDKDVETRGARGSAVGWGTALQVGRSRVRFPMMSLEFFIDTNLLAALWPWGRLSLTEMTTKNISWGVKAAGA